MWHKLESRKSDPKALQPPRSLLQQSQAPDDKNRNKLITPTTNIG